MFEWRALAVLLVRVICRVAEFPCLRVILLIGFLLT